MYHIALSSEEYRVTTTCNVCRKFGEIRTSASFYRQNKVYDLYVVGQVAEL